MITLDELYENDPIQKVIDEGAGWGAEQMLKAGVPIYYRDELYPETMQGELFVKEYSSGAKFIVRKYLTEDLRLLEEIIRSINAL
ncbi:MULTISPECIES: hypothetical protein [unclassified Mucilaginibacter]|uniref:hypothetical protein n=1 Tax=unclassified Mucilaginibacter TaxID=2617802 RepID=UPI00095D012A|nr:MULTISPECIES: hypothetical protein [unclassified Mucilaginibacter]OJW12623.1 MAG: hypothetical protein BGO48_05950 [Mucilaginibacter sp. 44-25]PAW93026.1 hypothetical protein CKK33_05760 [Mucilaginibacter sp. MD40]